MVKVIAKGYSLQSLSDRWTEATDKGTAQPNNDGGRGRGHYALRGQVNGGQ